MKIGIPKEIKDNENRVGMTPSGVAEFIKHGHRVYVQHTAGENSGFSDASYQAVGVRTVASQTPLIRRLGQRSSHLLRMSTRQLT